MIRRGSRAAQVFLRRLFEAFSVLAGAAGTDFSTGFASAASFGVSLVAGASFDFVSLLDDSFFAP